MSNPLWINADAGQPEYNAQSLRRSMSGLLTKGVADRLGARAGVVPNGRDAVSLSGVQVTVHDCNVVLNPAVSSQDGPYIAHFTEHTHTLDPGDGSNARIDIVVARVYDDDHDGSGQREAVTEYITGTPGPTPVPPAAPAGALLLATIPVPADGTGSPTLDYVAPATVAAGGVLPVADNSEYPAEGAHSGMILWDRNLGALVARTADAWAPIARPSGWEVIHGKASVSVGTTLSIPSGVYDMIRVHIRGGTSEETRVWIRVNGDDTSALHRFAWSVWRLDTGALADANSGNQSVWPVVQWSSSSNNIATATIYSTQGTNSLTYQSEGYRSAFGESLRQKTIAGGDLDSPRLLSSIQFGTSGGTLNATAWIEGLRA